MKLVLPKKEFITFLDGLGKINDSIILKVEKDSLYALSASEDRSMVLWSKLEGDFEADRTFNLPSVKKLSKSLSLIRDTTVEFSVNTNNLEYKGTSVRFKYHLLDDGILVAPKMSLAKIEKMTYDYEFEVSREFITSLLKTSTIFKDTNKMYIFTRDGKIIWSLEDKTMSNKDVFSVEGDEVDFEMDEFIVNLDNFRLIDFGKEQTVSFKINKMGIGNVSLTNGSVELNYIISGLTK